MENKTPEEMTAAQEAQETTPNVIRIDMSGYDPKLDPNSPEFDIEAYKKAIADAGGMEAMTAQLKQRLDAVQEQLQDTMLNGAALSAINDRLAEMAKSTMLENMEALSATAAEMRAAALSVVKGFTDFIQSETYQTIRQSITLIGEFLEAHREEFAALAQAGEELQDLVPYLQMELEDAKSDPQFADCTITDLFQRGFDENGEPTDSPFKQIIERAKQRKAAFESAEGAISELEQAAEELPRIQYKKTTELKTVTDKLANVFFSLTAPAATQPAVNGQRQMTPLRYEGRKSKKEITLFYDYVYNEDVLEKYGLIKKFDDFDFFVMTIIDTLYAAGNDVVSFTKIYNEMGGEGSPTSKQLEPIYYSLLKGMTTIITIDDADAQKAWKAGAGTYHEIVSPVIPVQLGNERFIANGKIANGFVKINGVSPFMQVAKPLGHITAWEKGILRLYTGRKTKRYYSVMRFLMLQIGWMRNGTRSRKILYSSLYQYTGDTTTRAQQLTRDMMYRLLDEVFKPADYITAYKEEADPTPGVVLTLSKHRQKIAGK